MYDVFLLFVLYERTTPQMELFFWHIKDEIHLENCLTFEQLEKEINDYMDYYNHSRCQWDLKQMTPCEYREYLFRIRHVYTETDDYEWMAIHS